VPLAKNVVLKVWNAEKGDLGHFDIWAVPEKS